jgi:hypothetical protein
MIQATPAAISALVEHRKLLEITAFFFSLFEKRKNPVMIRAT